MLQDEPGERERHRGVDVVAIETTTLVGPGATPHAILIGAVCQVVEGVAAIGLDLDKPARPPCRHCSQKRVRDASEKRGVSGVLEVVYKIQARK